MDLILNYSQENFEDGRMRLQIHLSPIHSQMWEVIQNWHIKIKEINTAPPRPANSRSIEEDEGDQSEEEMSLPPLRLVRDLKPYDG